MNIDSPFYNDGSWERVLQNTNEMNQVDATHGKLISSEESFKVKIFDPDSGELMLNLDDIILISKTILTRTPQDIEKVKEMEKSLKDLEVEVRTSLDQHQLFGKPAFFTAMDFFGMREDFSEELDRLLFRQEPELELITPSQIKNYLLSLKNKEIDEFKMAKIRDVTRENKGLLFDLSEEERSFFHLAKNNCPSELLIELLVEVLQDLNSLESHHIHAIKNFMFYKEYPPSYFQRLMERQDSNLIFDVLVKNVTMDELNADLNMKSQMIHYGHAAKRYDYIFFQISDLPPEFIEMADTAYKNLKLPFLKSIKDAYKEQYSNQYKWWLEKRYESSSTLKGGDQKAVSRWMNAEDVRRRYSMRDRGSKDIFNFEKIQELHFLLCQDEVGIVNPGRLRSDTALTGGGWSHFYCPVDYLNQNLQRFMKWFSAGLLLCEEGKLNPIIFAAQTYQRCVSIHPFENGNGRISRILMDYVLERFGLPPPVLGNKILDGVFPMDVPKPNHFAFLNKIIMGIEKSRQILFT